MKVLLLSAYHANSHRRWAEGLMSCLPEVNWQLLSLPPRHFNWRIRGNSLFWAMRERGRLLADYDRLLVTSMVDLAGLRGLVPELAAVPTVVYFHENQFAYPRSAEQHQGVEAAMLNLYTALAADKIVFNSHYNRSTLLTGADALLAKLPDFVPRAEVMAKLAHSAVLPVGVDPIAAPARPRGGRVKLLWNHRWEYDKGPDLLLEIARVCAHRALPIDFHVVGQQFRRTPAAFEALRSLLQRNDCLELSQWGHMASETDYRRVLSECDVVLSTADHDFQGLSIMEAVAAGCAPLLPARLCYPEYYPAQHLYSGGSHREQANAAADKLEHFLLCKSKGRLTAPSVAPYHWQCLAPHYRKLLAAVER